MIGRRLLLVITLTSCVAEEDLLSETGSEMNSKLVYESSSSRYVEPLTAAVIERAMFHARVVGASDAFAQCVRNTMQERYMNCDDVLPDSSRSLQISAAWTRFRTWNNTMSFGSRPSSDLPNALASAPRGQETNVWGTHSMTLYDYFTRARDWAEDYGTYPWNSFGATMIHEYMHTLGYNHVDTVPYADPEAEMAACAARNGRSSYMALGNPAAPAIYSACAYWVMTRSENHCAGIHADCASNELNLAASWRGTVDDYGVDGGCTCVRDPRRVFALRTNTGQAITAPSGGGSSLSTNWSDSLGAWQWLYLYDAQGPTWASGDSVVLKSFAGNYLRYKSADNTFSADGAQSYPLVFSLVAGSTLGNAAKVTMRHGDRYAYSDGSKLRGATSPTDNRFHFTLVEPRRDHLIYLRSAHGKYLNTDSNRRVWNKRTEAELAGSVRQLLASSAMWIVDWNGGELMDGDVISLEQFENNAYHYLSATDGDHTGQVRMGNAINFYERFIIHRTSTGTGPITHDDTITLRSAHGTYLTAMPADYFDGQIRNYGTYEGAWQHFRIRFVSQHDKPRHTW